MSIYKEIHEKKQKVSNLIGHLAEAEVSGLSGQTEQIADPAGHRSSAKSTESLQLVIIKMKAERQEMTDKLTKITDENQQLRQMLAARSVEKDDFDKLKSGHTALLTQLKKCQSALAGRFTLAQELNAANEELQRQLKELKSADCPTLPCVKFNPVKTVDSLEEEKIPSELQSITAMEEYSAHSFEELRVEYILAGLKSSEFTQTTARLKLTEKQLATERGKSARLQKKISQLSDQLHLYKSKLQKQTGLVASLTEKNQILNAEMDQKVNLLKGIQEVLDKRGGGGGAPLGSYKLEETVFEDAVGQPVANVSLSQADSSTSTDSIEEFGGEMLNHLGNQI